MRNSKNDPKHRPNPGAGVQIMSFSEQEKKPAFTKKFINFFVKEYYFNQ